ncbi:unnamed protein product [Triticum turgidum subsp. durum]|uniref:F-box/LRR-repeat protein 15/At3g58940/PEG3-like LRR domain-containing protein n=1 Tax=Triticum turgidum subsp. durum TaxID=4567 RepID=A0A9R0WH79_TRITD|nr:unnamed protein product [Triticum turgidum subsp. durum]
MEVPRSRRRIRHSPPPPPPAQGCTGGDDLISMLPDDMLLQILTRLGCARAAARTCILARRWRNLWIHLPGLIFHDVPVGKVQAALTRVARRRAGMSVSALDIRLMRSVPPEAARHDEALAKKLLCKAVRLSPEELMFVLPRSSISKPGRRVEITMPCFLHATSIELDTYFIQIQPPANQILHALERLSLSGNIVDIGACLNQCPRLHVLRVTCRGVLPVLLEESLTALEAAVALGLTVSLLRIELELYSGGHTADGAQFASLLHAAVTEDKFLALERLSLQHYRCTILDLDTMVARCPRLRVLKVNADRSAQVVTIRSTSLQELELSIDEGQCEGINIETPLLTQLKLSVDAASDINVSIWAPMVEKVSYLFSYKKLALMFGFWSLQSLRVDTVENYKYKDEGLTKEGKDACSQPPRVHVLCLQISAQDQSGPVLNFARELEKPPVSNFPILALNLNAEGHVLAAFVSRILGMHHLQTRIQRLKVVLCSWSEMSKCVKHCPCNEPKN